jgi:hypothetical protein
MSSPTAESNPITLLQDALDQARAQARDQLAAAWQLHIARVEEQLRSGWQKHLDRLLDERFAELAATLANEIETAMAARVREEAGASIERERRAAAREIAARLNQSSRRLKQSGTQEEWCTALLDAAGSFSARAAVFTLQGSFLRFEKASFDAAPFEVPLSEAPAFAGVVESKDPVIAAFSPAELSEPVASALGIPAVDRVHLLPLISGGRTVAVLYAEAGRAEADPNVLELIASMAAAVWELRSSSNSATLVSIGPAAPVEPAATKPVTLPAWNELPLNEQEIHLRAQRFARVQAAEIRLYQSQAVKQGRAEQAIYRMLREPIDAARDSYREKFLQECPSMVDYFHVELVRTLANDDARLLGSDYPGPLV